MKKKKQTKQEELEKNYHEVLCLNSSLKRELNETEYELKSYKRIIKYSGWFVLILLLSGIGTITFFDKDIDEDKLCEDKLTKYFPEYDFHEINYEFNVKNYCNGFYYDINDRRDGLLLSGENKKIRFELINQNDIDYLNSDNVDNVLFGISVTIFVCLIFAFFTIYFIELSDKNF